MDLFSMTSDALEELAQSRSADVVSPALCPPGQAPLPAAPATPQHISSLPSSHAYLPALTAGLANLARLPVLILGVQSDILFPYEQQKELAEAIRRNGNRRVSYYELDSPYGHEWVPSRNVGETDERRVAAPS
jgi:homoserine acetyltransferase